MPRWPGFIGPSNTTQSLIADAERSVNVYVERASKDVAALLGTPGFSRWSTTGVSDVNSRAFTVANGRMFAVIGMGFYEFSSTGAGTKLGSVLADNYPAQLAYNGIVGNQLGIASGGNIYVFDLGTGVFSGPYLVGKAQMLAYTGGYGIAFDGSGTKRGYLSAPNDLTSWDLGTFFQRSLFSDPAVAMFVDTNGLIWTVGPETFEVRYNSGVGTQPFVPLSGLVGRYGIEAPFAYSVSATGVQWLGRSKDGPEGLVMTHGASVPVPAGTYAVDTAIEGYRRLGTIADAEMLTYHDQKHTFINLSFPSARGTWTHDVEGQSWAERGQWNSPSGTFDVWAPRTHVDAFNKHLVGDRVTGAIYEMSTAYSTEMDGTGIRRLRRSPAIRAEHQRIPIDQIEILMDVGLGTQTGQGANPLAMLRVSQDGGRTFGNERQASVGRVGRYQQRVYWTRLGINADPVIEVSWTDPVPTRVVDAWINNAERAA